LYRERTFLGIEKREEKIEKREEKIVKNYLKQALARQKCGAER
jgi:hypothetical protein